MVTTDVQDATSKKMIARELDRRIFFFRTHRDDYSLEPGLPTSG